MARITIEEHKRRKDLLASLVREFRHKNPNQKLTVNKANDMLYSRVNARMNANTVKQILQSVDGRPTMRREGGRQANLTQTSGETIKVNLRDGREVYVVVL